MGQTHIALIGNQAFAMLNFRGSLIRELVARGFKVSAIAPDYDEASRQAIRLLGAEPVDHRFSRTGLNPLLDFIAFVRLAKHLRTSKPDLTLAFTIKPVVYGTVAAWIVGVPRRFAMIEGLGHLFMENSTIKARALRLIGTALYKIALSKASRAFFLNSDDWGEFVQANLVAPQNARVVGAIGVDLAVWRAMPPVTRPLTFVFVGRLIREKGIVEYVEAARRIKATHPQVRFLILGDLDSNPSGIGRSQVENWVAAGLVIWPGQVNVGPWLAQSSVFVLPSYREGIPRSTQEAMAMARPVITTDVPGCRETVDEERNGYLVKVRDVGSLAQAMMRFVMQPQLIETLGQKSREMAVQHFDDKKSNARLIAEMGL